MALLDRSYTIFQLVCHCQYSCIFYHFRVIWRRRISWPWRVTRGHWTWHHSIDCIVLHCNYIMYQKTGPLLHCLITAASVVQYQSIIFGRKNHHLSPLTTICYYVKSIFKTENHLRFSQHRDYCTVTHRMWFSEVRKDNAVNIRNKQFTSWDLNGKCNIIPHKN